MSVWGIDPGINGALVHFDPQEGMIDIHDMPIMEVRGKKLFHQTFSSDPYNIILQRT